jgi:hypothetical protein
VTDTNTIVGGGDASAKKQNYVGFEVLTAVVKKDSLFWNIMPCSLLNFNHRFERTCPQISA